MERGYLVEKVAKKTRVSKIAADQMLDIIFAEMAEALKRGEKVIIKDLLTLSVSVRQSRAGRNPQTGELIHINEKKAIRAKAGRKLDTMLNRRRFEDVIPESIVENNANTISHLASENERVMDAHNVFKELEDEIREFTPNPGLWLATPHGMLGGQSPLQLAFSSAEGKDIVSNLIKMIKAGMFT